MSQINLSGKPAEVILAAAMLTIVEFQKNLPESERVELWNLLATGYCPVCGSKYLPCTECAAKGV